MATTLKRIEIQNFKAIDYISQDFEDFNNLWLVTADNMKGKSTFLEAIIGMVTGEFEGKKLVRNGQEKGLISGEFEKDGQTISVKYQFKNDGTPPVVQFILPDGEKSNKKNDLRALFGHYVDIDVNKFLNDGTTAEGRRNQLELIKKLLPDDKKQKLSEYEDKINDKQKDSEALWNDKEVAKKILKEIVAESCKKLLEKDFEELSEEMISHIDKEELTDFPKEIRKKYSKIESLEELGKKLQLAIEEDKLRQEATGIIEKYNETYLVEWQKAFNTKIAELTAEKEKDQSLLNSIPSQVEKKKAELDAELDKKINDLKEEYLEKKKSVDEKAKEYTTSYTEKINTKSKEITQITEKYKSEKENVDKSVKESKELLAKEKVHNTESLNLQAKDIEKFNDKVKAIQNYDERHKIWQLAKEQHKEVREIINNWKKEREDVIRSCELPADNLSFDENGLYLLDVNEKGKYKLDENEEIVRLPFVKGNVSSSQAMDIVSKLIIGLNKEVKIFRISQGESMGSMLKSIHSFAKENGYTGFVERVQLGQEQIKMEIFEGDIIKPAPNQPITEKPIVETPVKEKKQSAKKQKEVEKSETKEVEVKESDISDVPEMDFDKTTDFGEEPPKEEDSKEVGGNLFSGAGFFD